MKPLGIVRKIDELGRVVVPMEVRRINGWEAGTSIEMFATETGLFLQEYGQDQKKKAVIENLYDLIDVAKDKHVEQSLRGVLEYVKGRV